jgi:hypothetical protein
MKPIYLLFSLFIINCNITNAQNIVDEALMLSKIKPQDIGNILGILDSNAIKKLNNSIHTEAESFKTKVEAKVRKDFADTLSKITNDTLKGLFIKKEIDKNMSSEPLFSADSLKKIYEFKFLNEKETKFLNDLETLINSPTVNCNFDYNGTSVISLINNIEEKRLTYIANYSRYKQLDPKTVGPDLKDLINEFLNSGKNLEKVPLVNLQQLSDTKVSVSVNTPPVQSANIYEALGNFLVERFKYEFTIEVIDKFVNDKSLDQPILNKLFPETFKIIAIFKLHPESTSLQILKLKFQEDLDNLPEHSIDALSDRSIGIINENQAPLLKTSISYFRQILKGKSSIEYFTKFADDIAETDPNYSSTFKSLKQLVNIYTIVKDNFKTNSKDDFSWSTNFQGLAEPVGKNILIALLCNLLRQNNQYAVLNVTNIDSVIVTIQKLTKNLNDVKFLINSLQNGNKNYTEYLAETRNIIANSLLLYKFLTGDAVTLKPFSDIIDNKLIDRVLNILLYIQRKEYINAASETYLIVVENGKPQSYTLKEIYKYINFGAQLSAANTNDEMKAAIENFVLPPLSVKQKRVSSWDFSLIGSPGIYLGHEHLENGEKNYFKFNGWGIYAPIGFDLSAAIGKGWSLSLFVPIIDLGAIFKYNFQPQVKDSIDYSSFTFSNFFSPGIYAKVGIKNSPLSVGIGFEYLPKFRAIKSGGNDIRSNSTIYGVTLSWDIDLLRFTGSNNF